MDLSSIFNNFPDPTRTTPGNQAGQSNKTQSVGGNHPSQAAAPAHSQALEKTDHADLSASGLAAAQGAVPAAATSATDLSNSDVRMGLVNSVQAALQTGTYNVPASDVADRIMQSMMG